MSNNASYRTSNMVSCATCDATMDISRSYYSNEGRIACFDCYQTSELRARMFASAPIESPLWKQALSEQEKADLARKRRWQRHTLVLAVIGTLVFYALVRLFTPAD